MPATVIGANGIATVVSDDTARALALEHFARAETIATKLDQHGYGDIAAARAEYELAEDLLRQIGDVNDTPHTSLKRFYESPPDPEEHARALDQRARAARLAEAARQLVGAAGAESPRADTGKVRQRREQRDGREVVVVSGRGPTLEFKSWDEAERECFRRIGRRW